MIKRQINVNAFDFANYIVTLERLRCTPAGQPRFEAIIISKSGILSTAAKYRFTGHYTSEREEAEFILNEYLKTE